MLVSRFALFASSFLLAHGASAEQVHLDAQAINSALPGSVLRIDTPLGIVVPVTFGNDGLMSGEAGQLASMLGSQKDRGRWWTDNDHVCFKWFRWFDAEPHCLSV